MQLEAETEVKQSVSQGTLGVNSNWKRQGRVFLYYFGSVQGRVYT